MDQQLNQSASDSSIEMGISQEEFKQPQKQTSSLFD